MKGLKVLALTALMVAGSGMALAQDRGVRKVDETSKVEKKQMMGSQHERVMAELNLTDAQKKQMEEMRAKHQAEMKQQRSSMQEMNKKHQEEMEAILTPEQKEKMKQLKAERQEKRKEMRQDMKMNGHSKKGEMKGKACCSNNQAPAKK
jgi:Spy/CpxP family protein refolding chaperone